jgi:hypothetical protein
MTFNKKLEIIESLKNGNISDFNKWVKQTSKLNLLDMIEFAQGQGFYKRHEIIYIMFSALEN